MPSQNSNESSAKPSSGSGSSGSDAKPMTHYRYLKEHWDGDRPKFQGSFLLKTIPGDIEEGNAILDALIKHEYGNPGETGEEKSEK